MRLALFNEFRLGVVVDGSIVDVTSALPPHDTAYGSPFWVRLCRDFERLRPRIERLSHEGALHPLDDIVLRSPVLYPSKVVAAAANYASHIQEMSAPQLEEWMLKFDVFLKAPSSIIDPNTHISLPVVEEDIHYEGELAVVIGKGGKGIEPKLALDHVLGYTILVDLTVRGEGDRSRRKSYDGFTPIGPWILTTDEVRNWEELRLQLWLNGHLRQDVLAGEMLRPLPNLISYASDIMTLNPGDVISTGAPAGVGSVNPGDELEVEVSELGVMKLWFESSVASK